MPKKLTLLILVLTLVWVTSACAGGGGDGSGSIQDTNWQWESVTRKSTGELTTVPDPENYTLIFRSDGTFEGQADCNAISGTYSQEGGFAITLGPTTMAFCGDDSLDQQFLELLGNIAAGGPYGEGGLALETAGGAERMEFTDGGTAP
jgi:heat shock protein HslJ